MYIAKILNIVLMMCGAMLAAHLRFVDNNTVSAEGKGKEKYKWEAQYVPTIAG